MRALIGQSFVLVTLCLVFITSKINASNVQPAEEHEHNHENGHAHVHGLAQLTVAIEKKALLINFSAPAESLVGFEHSAETKQDVARVTQLENILSDVSNVINLAASACKIVNKVIDTSSLLISTHKHQHKHKSSTHAEISAEYELNCQQLSKVASTQIVLFKHFPAIENIEAFWINNNKQGAANLTPANTTLFWQ